MTELTPSKSAKPSNSNAWGSIFCSLFSCLPPASIVGLILGVRGFKFARSNGRRGLSLSLLGITFNAIGMVFFLWFTWYLLAYANSTRRFVKEFLANLEKGDIVAAQAQCDQTFTADDVEDLSEEIKALGPLGRPEFTLPTYQSSHDNHGMNRKLCHTLDATLTLSKGKREIDIALIGFDATFRVHRFKLNE